MTPELLAALGHTRMTAQTFFDPEDDEPACDERGRPLDRDQSPQKLFGTPVQLHRTLLRLNSKRMGVFFMTQPGDLRGRSAENVVGVTNYFADLDGTPLLSEYPLTPTAIVESSPERYHLYWRITNAERNTFSHVQKHIANILDSDPKVIDLPRVMRLPGYLHQKYEPFKTRILSLNAEYVYDQALFWDAFAVPEFVPPRTIPPLPGQAQAYMKSRGNGSGRHVLLGRIASAPNGARNDTLFKNACAIANDIFSGKVDQDTAIEECRTAGLMAGLPEREIETTIRSALRYARAN